MIEKILGFFLLVKHSKKTCRYFSIRLQSEREWLFLIEKTLNINKSINFL